MDVPRNHARMLDHLEPLGVTPKQSQQHQTPLREKKFTFTDKGFKERDSPSPKTLKQHRSSADHANLGVRVTHTKAWASERTLALEHKVALTPDPHSLTSLLTLLLPPASSLTPADRLTILLTSPDLS